MSYLLMLDACKFNSKRLGSRLNSTNFKTFVKQLLCRNHLNECFWEKLWNTLEWVVNTCFCKNCSGETRNISRATSIAESLLTKILSTVQQKNGKHKWMKIFLNVSTNNKTINFLKNPYALLSSFLVFSTKFNGNT